jgi:hypothetical protein
LINDNIPPARIVLRPNTVLLPQLKVSVWMGRFNLETLGTQEIDVHCDPAMDPDLWTSDDAPREYFLSSATAPALTGFGFRDRVEDDVCIYSNSLGRPEPFVQLAETSAGAVSRVLDVDERTAFRVLHLVIGAIGQLRDWQLPVVALSRVQLRFEKTYLDVIEEQTGLSFPQISERECLIAEWPCEITQTPR